MHSPVNESCLYILELGKCDIKHTDRDFAKNVCAEVTSYNVKIKSKNLSICLCKMLNCPIFLQNWSDASILMRSCDK